MIINSVKPVQRTLGQWLLLILEHFQVTLSHMEVPPPNNLKILWNTTVFNQLWRATCLLLTGFVCLFCFSTVYTITEKSNFGTFTSVKVFSLRVSFSSRYMYFEAKSVSWSDNNDFCTFQSKQPSVNVIFLGHNS